MGVGASMTICVRDGCIATRRLLGDLREQRAALQREVQHLRAEHDRLAFERFDWTDLGGEAVATTLTATERRIVQALSTDGRVHLYVSILRKVWPEQHWDERPSGADIGVIRTNLCRLRPVLRAHGWNIVSQVGYGLALRPWDGILVLGRGGRPHALRRRSA
jgi:hypothetical protein